MKPILILFTFFVINSVYAQTPADDRPAFKLGEINVMREEGANLCPKKFGYKYHHHFVLIDTSTGIAESEWHRMLRVVFPEDYLQRLKPWDKVTIMNFGSDVTPSENKPIFSMCRPRSGDVNSPYKIDRPNKFRESVGDLKRQFHRFSKDGIYKAVELLKANEFIGGTGSPILEQISEIFKIRDLDFHSDSGYESRRLTIVSDLFQNSNRLNFYESCVKKCPSKLSFKNKTENKYKSCKSKCPSWSSFKNKPENKYVIKKILPSVGQNISVDIVYLNHNEDPDLNRGVLPFWEGFFIDSGIKYSASDVEIAAFKH